MNAKDDLTTLVGVQSRELELVRIDGEMADVERGRAAARAEIEAAEGVVSTAEAALEAARGEARRLDVDLKAAEEKVSHFKDQVLAVKTNQELWAIQKEIGHAESVVGDVETGILEQLETADSLEAVIGEKKSELADAKKRVDAAIAEADRREAELVAAKASVDDALAGLRQRISGDLMKKYESIKTVRGGVGVAEVLDEICLVCNFKVRPQLYVETFNFAGTMQCENCGRILYIAERLGMATAADTAGGDDAPAPPTPSGDQLADSEPAAAADGAQ